MSSAVTCRRCGKPVVSSSVRQSLSPSTGEAYAHHDRCARISGFANTLTNKLAAFDPADIPELLAEIALEMGVVPDTLMVLGDTMRREELLSEFDKTYREAFLFASRAHVSQLYGAAPYTEHLVDVARTLVEFGFSPSDPDPEIAETSRTLVVAGLLHDTLEDTNAGYEEILARFGKRVADIVLAVSNEAGKNRKERFAKTYPKIRANADAVALKLADRISNGRACRKDKKPGIFRMYQEEWPEFETSLRRPGEYEAMWECLERLFGMGRYSGM